MHIVITDSGLGGLSICAGVERALRQSGRHGDVRLTYVNAWPEQGRGYNDLPDMPARARVFDLALRRMDQMGPDLILIACNTLSILYGLTAHRRTGAVKVQGIVDAGVELFHEALTERPSSAIVLLGTRTTVESGVHRDRLLQRGIAAARIASASCHGLATAIERGPGSESTRALIGTCAERAGRAAPPGDPLFAGLCCTHYGLVADRLCAALARQTGREIGALDPNERLVRDVTLRLVPGSARFRAGSKDPAYESRAADESRADDGAYEAGTGSIAVEVISKVELDEGSREGVAALIDPVSPPTARALRAYRHEPDLF